ncbi:GNAT family N-acetyltransferase [Microbacterium sp. NPDC076911]|uniref:GNAT family N-acetyltransferase n=1 Tax=Microbacterium sp. NPDC076911 TaxID=3154958 RepID=UPI00344117B4
MTPVVLRTPRLTLAAPTDADIEAIYEACQDPEIPRWTPVPNPYARTDAEDFVAKSAEWWLADTEYTWAIHHEGALAGVIGMYRMVRAGSGEIGFWMTESSRGKGILTEAARAVIDFGFSETVSLKRIEWRAVVGNVASAKTARGLGFQFEGMLRQALASPRGRDDGWIAGLLSSDDRTPKAWPILTD